MESVIYDFISIYARSLKHFFWRKCYFYHLRDLQVFEELFSFACPKFLSPVVPNYDNVHPNYHKEPFQQQLKVFAEEVQQQAQLSTIRRWVHQLVSMWRL